MLHVGYRSYIVKDKVLAITSLDSSPLKKRKQMAEKENKLIDCTKGKRADSLIHLVDGFVVTSAINAETLAERMGGKE